MKQSKRNTKNLTNKCNICDAEIEEDNGDIVGNVGILPISFCVWCLSSITDMVIQLNGFDNIETLEEKISELKEEKEYELESCS